MDILWAPWRSQYIEIFATGCNTDCFICDAIHDKSHEDARLVVCRTDYSIVMLNKYPYNGGHILIAPNEHTGDFTLLSPAQINDIMELTKRSINALKAIKKPDAFNIGMNMGRSAGAGLPEHIHQHIIPRWNGDTGFISTICNTKVISEALQQTLSAVRNEFDKSA